VRRSRGVKGRGKGKNNNESKNRYGDSGYDRMTCNDKSKCEVLRCAQNDAFWVGHWRGCGL
jgi:hypothetical protein